MLVGEGVYVGNQSSSCALSNIKIMTVTVTVTVTVSVTLNIARGSSKCTVYNAQIHSGPVWDLTLSAMTKVTEQPQDL